MNELKIGDRIRVGQLETKVKGFSEVAGQQLVATDYGDFNPDLVEKVETELLKKGDKVVMHTCYKAKYYNGKVWTCRTDEYEAKDGDMVVFLEDYSGMFLTEYLQKVNI